MGVGLGIFIVNDDDSLERLAPTRYERLILKLILWSLMPSTTLLKNVLTINLDASLLRK
jgi:hypothetical protein